MTRLAILGLEASLGPGLRLEDFARAIYAGRPLATLPSNGAADGAADLATSTLGQVGRVRQGRLAVMILAPGMDELALNVGQAQNLALPLTTVPTLAEALVRSQHWLAEQRTDLVLLSSSGSKASAAIALARADEVASEETYALIEISQPEGMASPFDLSATSYLELLIPLAQSDLDACRTPGRSLTCALSGGAPSELAALVKVALCLHRRYLPPWLGPEELHPAEKWHGTPFYVAPEARPWFSPHGSVRRAALRLGGETGPLYVVLEEPGPQRQAAAVCPQPGASTQHLVVLAGSTQPELLNRLAEVRKQIRTGLPIAELARGAFAAYQKARVVPLTLALASHDLTELAREVEFALEGVPKAFASGQPWTTPRGSYFTARPLGPGGLTFVYPGAFNAYVGMGRDLFQYFPWLHEGLSAALPDLGRSLSERLLYPRHLATSARDADASMGELAADPAAMIEAGIVFSMALTALLRDIFRAQPQLAFGYSLGEVSMLWAGEVWQDATAGSAAWRTSPLFKSRLFGPKEAVGEAWGREGLPPGEEFWHTYLLKAPVDKVRAALTGESRVYLTMINLPDEVVIAGEPAGCLRVIAGLKGHVIRVPFDSVLHNPAMQSEHGALADLYNRPVHAERHVTFLSAGRYAPLPMDQAQLAGILADMTCQPLDFPRLVNTAYDRGARLFVEVGPQGTCTRWIERILRGREFAALPLNRPRAGDFEGVVAALAMLVSQGVPVNLAPLYGPVPDDPIRRSAARESSPAQPYSFDHARHLGWQAALRAEGHQAFLQARQTAMRQTAELMQLQTSLSGQMLALATSRPVPQPGPLMDHAALQAFASGDPEACFGPAYAVYRGRRLPRLPNGDLLLVDRVVATDCPAGKVSVGASLSSEFDAPADAWFLNGRNALPHAALMELALQPCGVLAAYMGSTLPYPDQDFYFRNLDGQAELLREVDVRGQTVSNRVCLLSSSALPGIILQKYEFELTCGGLPFYRGNSSFGYFTRAALRNQAGLGDAELPPQPDASGEWTPVDLPQAGQGQLDFLEQAWVSPRGGRQGLGRVYAEAPVRSTDWYFACHFYQDPVMPGSLGVEAVRQAVQILGSRLGTGLAATGRPLPGKLMTWRYRGQMTPEDGRLRLDAHINHISATRDGLTLLANASVWKGACRLYEIKQLGITLPTALAHKR